jgi:Zn-dependent protease
LIIIEFAVLIYSVILHEAAHGWVADWLGDPTARLKGRLTLDPRPHIDPLMTLGLPFLLILTGSPIIFGAAKPVPVDTFNLREPKKDMALISAAGPVTNLLIALFFAILFRLSPFFFSPSFSTLNSLFVYGASINVTLAIFNLLPLPPLDGAKVVAGVLPDKHANILLSLERFGLTFIIVILFFFSPIIDGIVMPVSRTILKLLFF